MTRKIRWFGLQPDGRLHWSQKVAGALLALAVFVPVTLGFRLAGAPKLEAERAVEASFGPAADFKATKIFNSLYQTPPSAHLGRHQLVCGTAKVDGKVTVIAVLSRTGRRGRTHSPEIFTPERFRGRLYPAAGPTVLGMCESAAGL